MTSTDRYKPAVPTDEELVDIFLAYDGIPINPALPADFDRTQHEDRPECHKKLWGKPYIKIIPFHPWYKDDCDRRLKEWLEAWPHGVRYDVRRLDGDLAYRSTCVSSHSTLERAIECAESLVDDPTVPRANC